jgi:hypothetical protein
MSTSQEISNLIGNYGKLSFPVLGVIEIHQKYSYAINSNFRETFLNDFPKEKHVEIIENHLSRLQSNTQLHHKGNIFNVDTFQVTDQTSYLFYSLSNFSVHHSFLWLKHDLLNTLNPILGFADILEESEDIPADDLIFLGKIKKNAEKLYQQIQKLALLQNLENKSFELEGIYELSDFTTEFINQLQGNNIFSQIDQVEMDYSVKVSDRIIHPDFINTLEEYLKILSSYQENTSVQLSSSSKASLIILRFLLPNCLIPDSFMEQIEEVNSYITDCKPINKIQTNTINFLVLRVFCESFGAHFILSKSENDISIEIQLPGLSAKTKIQKPKHTSGFKKEENFKKLKFNELPPDLHAELVDICLQFDGLFILDNWQELSNKLKSLDKTYDNKPLESIISSIDKGIQSFDIEILREVYHECKAIIESET